VRKLRVILRLSAIQASRMISKSIFRKIQSFKVSSFKVENNASLLGG